MTVCTQGWTYEDNALLLRGLRPSKPVLEQALSRFEKEGCNCGRALDCPLMSYLLNDDGGNEPAVIDIEQPSPPFEVVNIATTADEPEPEQDWDEDEWDSVDDDDIDMANYDFTDDGAYKPNPMTSFNEKDLVNDVFKPSSQIYSEEEEIKRRTGAGHLINEIEEQEVHIANYADTTIRLQQDNRVLREKLDEMELQVNQQLREIATRQQQQGDVEKMISDTKRVNKDLTWAITSCLKMLKFLPDSSKMNFRNSRDFKRMLEIYKEHVEPHKEEIR